MDPQDPTKRFIDSVRYDENPGVMSDGAIDWNSVLDELGDGPFAADVFLALCDRVDGIPGIVSVLSKLLAGLNDVAAAQETVSALCAIAPPPAAMTAFFETLRKLVHDRDRHYGARAAALRGTLYLAQFKPSLLRHLQGDLLDLDRHDDPHFLRHAAAVVGLVAAHKPDDDFVDLLRSLADVPEATDEAAYALGLIDLGAALGERERGRAIDSFASAKRWFEKAADASAGRPDARLFVSVIGILLTFAAGEAPSSIRCALPDLRESLFHHLALTSTGDGRPQDLSWIGQKAIEASHWATVGLALSGLADNMDRDAWLYPIMVIENELFLLLSASRTLFRRTTAGGFEAAISPRIETHFVVEKTKLSVLDQWLETKSCERWGDEARRLRKGIGIRLEALANRNPPDAADGASPLAAIEGSEAIDDSDKAVVRALMKEADRTFSAVTSDPVVNTILEDMLVRMHRNPDFVLYRDAAALFATILRVTLRFVYNRDNAQEDTANWYLFDRSKPGPKENALHADYMNALRLSDLARVCVKEAQDVGAGRVDVQFLHGGTTLVSECKLTYANEGNDRAAIRFGGQLIAYQQSSVTFSALVILDLFDRRGHAEHLKKRATVEFVTHEGTEYALAVFRLQGRRKNPSKLKV